MFWFKIKALAYDRSELRRKLMDGRSDQFLDHAIKIILNQGKDNFIHWTDEMFGFCSWIQNSYLKSFTGKKKYIQQDLILQYFFGNCDDLSAFQVALNNQSIGYGLELQLSKIDIEKTFINYKNFCYIIAKKLGNRILNVNILRQLVKQYLLNNENFM